MIDGTGLFNNTHRRWTLLSDEECSNCLRKNKNDSLLELFLRFRLSHILRIEEENFTILFEKYPGIIFNPSFSLDNVSSFSDIIEHAIKQKLTVGVGFQLLPELRDVSKYTSNNFCIPILIFGKMWQLISKHLMSNDKNPIVIDIEQWTGFSPQRLKCLACNNYPYGIYPGNFIVNQNILYMKTFVWMDKRRPHTSRKLGDDRIIMYKNSNIISWPIWGKKRQRVNRLGNMAFFTSGEIFTTFIDIIISKIRISNRQNELIGKIKRLRENDNDEFSVKDLTSMYKYCRKIKMYEISKDDNKPYKRMNLMKRLKRSEEKDGNDEEDEEKNTERLIIDIILSNKFDNDNKDLRKRILAWFKFPKSRINLGSIISETSQMIKRGEIDSAITQTSILNKDYNLVNSETNNKNNLDVHRIGRYTRNAATNDFCNMCGISCGLQKVLPKESKTKEPKMITKSEIGFIDLLNTPDTPRNCGLALESVVDVIVSTPNMCCEGNEMESLFRETFDDLEFIPHPENLKILDNDQYICANHRLYRFTLGIPKQLLSSPSSYEYLVKHYGSKNYFRMVQYVLKTQIPCIELLEQNKNFWTCFSFAKSLFKIHSDGLLYTANEMEYFEYHPDIVKQELATADYDPQFISLWLGQNRTFTPNLFGPSVRGTLRPNANHLPRVSHACSSWKHAVGLATNTNQVGSLHQKTLTVSYYSFKLNASEIFNLPGQFPFVLVAGCLNNQEDGIIVKKSSIERGLFLANSYETAAVKINYGHLTFSSSPLVFTATVKKGQILRPGLQIGMFRNKLERDGDDEKNIYSFSSSSSSSFSKDKPIENFSSEIKLIRCCSNGGFIEKDNQKDQLLAVIWVGKQNDIVYRCQKVECIDANHYLKLYLIYSSEFKPSVGDKLQTPTSQKGVISEILQDEDIPYIVLKGESTCFYPDIIISPQYLKRQALNDIYITGQVLKDKNDEKCPYMNGCFSYSVNDTAYYLKLGERWLTGIVMNPRTGLPFMKPVSNPIKGKKYYSYPNKEYLNCDDGFTYISSNNDDDAPHELVIGSIYCANYFNVNNHKASNMMQSSKCEDIIRTEFTGTPVRGKRGGFGTGPQEHLALVGMGMERFISEISLLRSDYREVEMFDVSNTNTEILGASSTFMRMNDDLNMQNLNTTYKVFKHS